jgi:hypothetical protein
MTQKDKQLLLKDLCARLLYNVWIGDEYGNKWKLVGIDISTTDAIFKQIDDNFGIAPIETIKPYLRSMSSMTEEEEAFVYNGHIEFWKREEYCNKHYLDYRGLIPMGLAIEVTEENNPYKE